MTRVYCNKCGKIFDEYDLHNGAGMWVRAHYGSKFDGDEVHMDICISCMDELIDSCVINPINTENTSVTNDEDPFTL